MSNGNAATQNPHGGQRVLRRGPSPRDARAVCILIHGRGASAEDIMGLSYELPFQDVSYLAPQAANSTWYPYSFLSPIPQNEPGITSGLGVIARLIEEASGAGVTADRVMLLGFSQGACLSLEFAARHARRYAGVAGLSGGVIGPPGTPRAYAGSLQGTPIFLGCSDVDPHIPLERVHETRDVFAKLGAEVDERIYPGMGHTVTPEELDAVTAILARAGGAQGT